MKYKKIIISVLLTLIILFFLFRIVNIKDIVSAFSRISFFALLLSFVAYLFGYVFKALRFIELNEKKIDFKKMFSIVCIHNFFNNLIPARIGELSYIYLIAKQKNSSTEKGIATLILARLMDLFMVLLLTFFVLLIFKLELPINKTTYFIITFVFIIIFIMAFLIFFYRKQVYNFIRKIIHMTKIKKIKIALRLLNKFKKSIDYFEIVRSKKIVIKSILYTLGTMFSQYIFFYIIMVGLGLDISFIKVVLGSIIILIAVILPVQGIGGFGTYEGAWTIALIFLGFSLEIAIITSFVIHILQIVYLILLGVLGLIYYKFIKAS